MVTLDKRHNEQSYNAETAFSSSSDLELGDENPIFSLIWKQRKGQYCHAKYENVTTMLCLSIMS